MLRLAPDLWDLVQVDVDGAALQVISFADTLTRLRNPDRRSHATPDEATVPALRSGGLSMALTGRADRLLEDLRARKGKNDDLAANRQVVLFAEDLLRGYRVDVRDRDAPGGARWFSLQRRVSEHETRSTRPEEQPIAFQITDEGYLKATSASSERDDHPTPSTDLYLHEMVFGWDGWSLAAARPGKSIVEPGQGADKSSIDRFDPEAARTPLVSRVAVEPRTLPRMRVGHRYQLRARSVDLAGNSRPFTERDIERAAPNLTSQEHEYFRVEPLPSPAVLRRHLDTEGESLETVVIRSDLDVSAADYAASPRVAQALKEQKAPYGYSADSQRHLAPPKGSEQMAEQHGQLDAAFGGTAAAATQALRTALREEGTFLDERIVDRVSGQKTLSQTTIELFPPGTALPARRGDPLAQGAYAIYPDASVILPYLPDPLAIGVALTGYDYAGKELFRQVAMFAGAWPDLAPMRLRVLEGPLAAVFEEGVLEVRLPQSAVVYARLSSVFPPAQLEQFAMWDWAPEASKTAAARDDASNGRHWMLTPFRWLTLVHAVQRPLAVPDMTQVRSSRTLGSTFVEFSGPIASHAKSTGRLDVLAAWTEDVDLLTDDAPRMSTLGTAVPHQASAWGFDLEPTEDQAQVSLPNRISRHELGDTRHRYIVYHSVATTRFREFLPRSIAEDSAGLQRIESAAGGDGAVVAALRHNILSTARPAAPDVAYIVPTFRWEKTEGATSVHVRRGNSVRVWLRRPWFSSGDEEKLAVVLRPFTRLPPDLVFANDAAQFASAKVLRSGPQPLIKAGVFLPPIALRPAPTPEEIRKMLQPYVSQWGADPVWRSARPRTGITPADFTRRSSEATGLTLDEIDPAATVSIAAHDVVWDGNRKLWYCDIELDAGDSYFPFVRLALARYQPHSVAGAHLSRVTMTDFIQLAPDRRATVSLQDGRALVNVQGYSAQNYVGLLKSRQISVSQPVAAAGLANGPLASAANLGPLIGNTPAVTPDVVVRVALQQQSADAADDHLGWTLIEEIVLTPHAAGFQVTWDGSIAVPDGGGVRRRLLITESETFVRMDLIDGDPNLARSPADFVRERVTYADVFELSAAAPAAGGEEGGVGGEEPEPVEPPYELPGYRGPDAALPQWAELPPLVQDPLFAVNAATKLAQALLNSSGDDTAPLMIDGKFGPLTGDAIQRFRDRALLPPGRMLDPDAWLALAFASPYPRLEPGIGSPSMAGPPISIVQGLLNLAMGEVVAPVTGSYDDDTRSAVSLFQRSNGLEENGVVDLPTWLALTDTMELAEVVGAERVIVTFDRDLFDVGANAFAIMERTVLESAPTPTSDSLTQDWTGYAGFWLELQDSAGRPLYRRILGRMPGERGEVAPAEDLGERMVRRAGSDRQATLDLVVPTIPAARRLCLFGNIVDPDASAVLLQAFDPWNL